jgi:hypothetical protein
MVTKLRITTMVFALLSYSMSFGSTTTMAVNAVGDLCVNGTGITGGTNCTITKSANPSSSLAGKAVGTTPLTTTTTNLDQCSFGEGYFNYTIDPTWQTPGGKGLTTNITLLRWFMRKPKTLSMTLSIGRAEMKSASTSFVFFEKNSSQTTTETTDAPLPAYDGGGELLLTSASIVEIEYRETRGYQRQQIFCMNTNKITKVLDYTGMPVRGKTPISKYNVLGETQSPKLVLTPVSSTTYEWAAGIYKNSDFNTCVVGPDNSTRKNISVNANSSTRTFATTSARSGGIKIPLGDYLTMGVSSESTKSISVTFLNTSPNNYKRVICVQPKSPGNFSDLRFSNNSNAITGTGIPLKAGMLLSVKTVCNDDSVAAPCP